MEPLEPIAPHVGQPSLSSSSISCPCLRHPSSPNEEDFLLGESIPPLNLKLLRCSICHKCRGLLAEDGNLLSLQATLRRTPTEGESDDGWQEVVSRQERQALFVLSQIVHNEDEGDPLDALEFSLPPITDLAKILWTNGEAVGFYSAKPKGTFDPETMSSYVMPTLDTIFIRQSHRGRGFGVKALEDLRDEFPCQKIGFSYPLTPSMRQVLWKHLKETGKDRPLFWETTGDVYGTARNVWLTLQREKNTIKILNKL